MVHRLLVLIACACSALCLVSFALFARDQVSSSSKHQENQLIAQTGVNTVAKPPTAHQEAQPRRFIDGAAKRLTSPFSSIVQSDSDWVKRGIPVFFAVLVWGGGLGFAARYTRGMS